MEITSIESDADHKAALKEIERLWGAADGTADGDELDRLVDLVAAYEEARYPIEPMNHRGYQAELAWDEEDRIFHGRIIGIRDGVGFHSDTADGVLFAFREAVDNYIETCARIGKEPEVPRG